jgi:2-methylcitrate dehydratase
MKFPRRQFLHLAAGAAALPGLARLARGAEPAAPALAERLAAYADGLQYDDLDAATVERAKMLVVDTIGCGIAALDEGPVRICRNVVLATSGDGSTVIGTNRRAAPDLAAFANGAAFRYYDLNDAYTGPTAVHPSDNIAPCLAVAESERASATELITAIVLSYEITCRLIDAFDISDRGWDPPVVSLPAVALAAGRLMKLPAGKLAQAVSLALNDHIPMGQTRAQVLSDWKGLADAEAGRNAIFAAMLARGGLTGPAPIFEGKKGFFQLVSGPADVDVAGFGRRGIAFKIHQCGMKAYPVVVYGQAAVVCGAALGKEIGDLDRISSIEVVTTTRGLMQTGTDREKWTPETRETADHSLPYIAVRAMVDGEITNDSYTPQKLHDPRILRLMHKVTVNADPAFGTLAGNAPPVRIVATLDDGRRVTKQIDNIPGFPGMPMSRADVERKFRGNVGARWPQAQTDAILGELWALDQAQDLPSLLGRMSVQKS